MIETGIPPEWKEQWEQGLEQLEDPLKLKFISLGLVVAIGFFAVYRPFDDDIRILKRQISEQQSRAAMIQKVEALEKTRASMLGKIPENGNVNFWTEYLIGGVRESGVVLTTLESDIKKLKIGHFQPVQFKIEVEGTYPEIYRLIAWIEEGEWFARVSRMRFRKRTHTIEAALTVAVLADMGGKPGA